MLRGAYADYCSSCAALNGVDGSVVNRANELVDLSAKGEDLVAACASISQQEEDDLREAVSRPIHTQLIELKSLVGRHCTRILGSGFQAVSFQERRTRYIAGSEERSRHADRGARGIKLNHKREARLC